MSLSEEAANWEASVNKRPYGKAVLPASGATLYTPAAIPPLPPQVSETIGDSAYIWFKLVNYTVRRIPVKLSARLSDKVRWCEGHVSTKKISTFIPAALDGRPGERNEMANVNAIQDGHASCETHEQGDSQASALSEFFISFKTKPMKRDYLGAIAAAVEGLPGAGIILGPLLKLRDDEQRTAELDELNAKLDLILAKKEVISAPVFQKYLGDSPDKQMAAEAAAVILTNISGNKHVKPLGWDQLRTSDWPFPFKAQIVRLELNVLFGSLEQRDSLVDCVRIHSPDLDLRLGTPAETINSFISAIAGQERQILYSIFDCLLKKRSGSMILKACVAVLSDTGPQGAAVD